MTGTTIKNMRCNLTAQPNEVSETDNIHTSDKTSNNKLQLNH